MLNPAMLWVSGDVTLKGSTAGQGVEGPTTAARVGRAKNRVARFLPYSFPIPHYLLPRQPIFGDDFTAVDYGAGQPRHRFGHDTSWTQHAIDLCSSQPHMLFLFLFSATTRIPYLVQTVGDGDHTPNISPRFH